MFISKCVLRYLTKYLNNTDLLSFMLVNEFLYNCLKIKLTERKNKLKNTQTENIKNRMIFYSMFDSKLYIIINGERVILKRKDISLLDEITIRIIQYPNLKCIRNESRELFFKIRFQAVSQFRKPSIDYFSFVNNLLEAQKIKLIIWSKFEFVDLFQFSKLLKRGKIRKFVIIDFTRYDNKKLNLKNFELLKKNNPKVEIILSNAANAEEIYSEKIN